MTAEVFDDHPCSLGEGPLWHPDRESLFWFDIDNKVMFEKSLGGQRIEYRFDRTVSAAGLIAGSETELIVASECDLFLFDLRNRNQRQLCALEPENRITRPNDGRADPHGGFWIGTMGFEAEENAGAIYRYFKGELRRVFADVSIPNSICFSPDGSFGFYTDSDIGIVQRVELDRDGWPVNEPPISWLNLSDEDFAPDGAVCDATGNFWSAQWNASRVAVYSQSGQLTGTFQLPTSHTTCPAFGGPDFSTLFVTTAGAHLPDPLKASQHQAGFTFAIPNAGSGKPESRVIV